MRILFLGATGSIGSAVLDELLAHDHSVLALARSTASETLLRGKGADVLSGDLLAPEIWTAAARNVDAIIHLATTFDDDMAEVDGRLIEALIAACKSSTSPKRFIYTGGCWMYGQTGNVIATETTPLDPIDAFAWAVGHAEAISKSRCFDLNVIHPAMVYDHDGGVFDRFIDCARNNQPIEVWGSLQTRWPLVHRQDVATAYRLVLEKAPPGETYNIAAEPGLYVADIVQAIMQQHAITATPVVRDVNSAIAEHGAWALGPTIDQQMSGEKIARELGWKPAYPDALAAFT